MAALGFNREETIGRYSNAAYTVWDLIPRNVLRDQKAPMLNEKDGKNVRKGIPFAKILRETKGKGTDKQGAIRHVTRSETACLSI